MKITVTLNGTDKNPYHVMGLKANPFPQIPKAEAAEANRVLRDLDANPIKNEADLRKRLEGCTEEFVSVCLQMYKPGARVRFVVEFPDPWG